MVDCEELEGLVMMGDGRADIHFFIQTVKDGTYDLYPYRNNYDILYSDQRDIDNLIKGGGTDDKSGNVTRLAADGKRCSGIPGP